ncbi:unnamed protein product [Amoebophrya sp. A25]|nr:unnamed protein product [Amoebophrya sp. A25]|eukprot:GSA25T00007783001.1
MGSTDLTLPDLLRLGDEHVARQRMVVINGADSKAADKWFRERLVDKLEKTYGKPIRGVPKDKLPFLVRQALSEGTALRRADSLRKNAKRAALQKTQQRFDRGHKGAEGFVATLKGKHINCVRGWRIAFKDDVLEHVGFGEFVAGCRKIGYTGEVKSLWNFLTRQPDPVTNPWFGSGKPPPGGAEPQNGTKKGKKDTPQRQGISYFDIDPVSVRKLHTFACMVEDSAREEGKSLGELWNMYANSGGMMRFEMFYEFFCQCAETFNRGRAAGKYALNAGDSDEDATTGDESSKKRGSDAGAEASAEGGSTNAAGAADGKGLSGSASLGKSGSPGAASGGARGEQRGQSPDDGGALTINDPYLLDPHIVPLTDPKIDSKVIFGALNFDWDMVIGEDEFAYLMNFLHVRRGIKKGASNIVLSQRRAHSMEMRRQKEMDWYVEGQFKKLEVMAQAENTGEQFLHAPGEEIDSRVKFRQLLANRCGSIVIGWRVYLDPESRGYITYSEFVQGCRRLGISDNLYHTWCDALCVEHLDDIAKGLVPRSALRQKTPTRPTREEQLKNILSSPAPLPTPPGASPGRNVGSSMSMAKLSTLPHLMGSANKSPISSPRSRASSPGGRSIQDILSSPSPTQYSADKYWLGIDTKSADFRRRKKYLDRHNKSMSLMFAHLDERSDRLLARMSELVREYSLEDVWTVLDPKNMVSITSREFIEQCGQLGFTRGESEDLFKCLDVHNSDLLTMEELVFLEKWNMPREEGDTDVARGNVASHCYKYAQQRESKQRMRNTHMTYMNLANNTHKKILAKLGERLGRDRSQFTERQLELRSASMPKED